MSFSTLYFDLTNPEEVNKVSKSKVNDLLLSQNVNDTTGSSSPFYIILKMNGLFRKRKPDFWKLLNKFQETPFPLKFITIFVDESPKGERPVIHLSQELQKDNVRIVWIPDSRGLEIDGQAVPLSIASWDEDPKGIQALNEFIEILKISEVYHDCFEKTDSQKVYIPGYKKLRVGFGDEKDNFDVFYKAINSITGNLNPANLPAIIFNKPSEMIIGSDLNAEDFIDSAGLLSENITEVLSTQRRLLYLFGIYKDKNSSPYKSMVKRASFSTYQYQEELNDLEKQLSKKIDELAEKLSKVDALSGLNNDDINKLLEIGINITAKSSEIENQQDKISESIWTEILKNLANGYSFEALMPNLENEIQNLTPKDSNEIAEKVKEVKKASIFKNLTDISSHMPKFLSSLLGGFWTKLLLTRNYILSTFVIAILIIANIQVSSARDLCSEELGLDLSTYNNVEFVRQFIVNQDSENILADRCRSALPVADLEFYFNYESFLELKNQLPQIKTDYQNGTISYDEYIEFIDTYNNELLDYRQRVSNVNNLLLAILTLLLPLLLYVGLTLMSVLLLFYVNSQIRSWGNNLGIKQFEAISKKLQQNVESIVLNDIKFGFLRNNLVNQMTIYKNLIEELQTYVAESQDNFMNLQVETVQEDEKSVELVNPKYVQKVTPIAQGQSQNMFDRVVKISRNEIIEMISSSSNNNLSKLFGRTPESFKTTVFEDFQGELLKYISAINTRGILELESLNNQNNLDKEELRAEIWKNDSIIKEPLEKIIQANKNDLTMQMISSDDIALLDKQNTEWKFLKFLPKTTIDWFQVLSDSDQDSDYTLTDYSETAGYLRLIPVNRNSMDVVQ
jgi:hypothetical protein